MKSASTRIEQLYLISCLLLFAGYFVKLFSFPDSPVLYAGMIFLLIAALSLFFLRKKFPYGIILLPLTILLIALFEKTKVPGIINVFENGARIVAPLGLLYLFQNKKVPGTLIKYGIAATFIAHGLLAMNIIPTPDSFYFMCDKLLNTDKINIEYFLFAAGVLDIIAAIALIFFSGNIVRMALLYCIIWGLFTAVARCASMIDQPFMKLFTQGFTETIVRLPNALLPLSEFIIMNSNIQKSFVKKIRTTFVRMELIE